VGIVNSEMLADFVILDAVMIKKLPRKIAAATSVDALAHAIECWTSNKANPFSDIFALQALDMILAIAFFVKLGGAYFDYRQRGQFEWTGPAILFACLIFSLIAPKYIWNIIGI